MTVFFRISTQIFHILDLNSWVTAKQFDEISFRSQYQEKSSPGKIF